MNTKLLEKRKKDAERKRWIRRQRHLQKQLDQNLAEEEKKVKVWEGTVANGRWMQASQLSTFCVVREIGVRKKKGAAILGAIAKFDGEEELAIVPRARCMESDPCLARQGGHPSAQYFYATRLLALGDMVLIKWQDRKKEQWLPKEQVKKPPNKSRSGEDTRLVNYIFYVLRPELYCNVYEAVACDALPFLDFAGFIALIKTKQQFKNGKACNNCERNQARRKGGLCNRCYQAQE